MSCKIPLAHYAQVCLRQLRSGNFHVKDEPRRDRSVVENIDKITELTGMPATEHRQRPKPWTICTGLASEKTRRLGVARFDKRKKMQQKYQTKSSFSSLFIERIVRGTRSRSRMIDVRNCTMEHDGAAQRVIKPKLRNPGRFMRGFICWEWKGAIYYELIFRAKRSLRISTIDCRIPQVASTMLLQRMFTYGELVRLSIDKRKKNVKQNHTQNRGSAAYLLNRLSAVQEVDLLFILIRN